MNIADAKKQLKVDYPHLTAHFEGRPGKWECHLCTMTRMYGLYGVFQGQGTTPLAALLDARRVPDERKAAAERARIEEASRAAAHAIAEAALDDEVFSSIVLPRKAA